MLSEVLIWFSWNNCLLTAREGHIRPCGLQLQLKSLHTMRIVHCTWYFRGLITMAIWGHVRNFFLYIIYAKKKIHYVKKNLVNRFISCFTYCTILGWQHIIKYVRIKSNKISVKGQGHYSVDSDLSSHRFLSISNEYCFWIIT